MIIINSDSISCNIVQSYNITFTRMSLYVLINMRHCIILIRTIIYKNVSIIVLINMIHCIILFLLLI